jgi:hypothetical protein
VLLIYYVIQLEIIKITIKIEKQKYQIVILKKKGDDNGKQTAENDSCP